MSHVADRVFLELVAKLERQRLGKKVIADMFGLALRSYRQKVQRLGESATDGGQTLWSAVMQYLRDRRATTKANARKPLGESSYPVTTHVWQFVETEGST